MLQDFTYASVQDEIDFVSPLSGHSLNTGLTVAYDPRWQGGLRLRDMCGNAHGTLVGDSIWQPSGTLLFAANKYVQATTNCKIPTTGTFSIFAWVYVTAYNSNYTVICEGQNPAGTALDEFSLMLNNNGKVATFSGNKTIDGSGTAVALNAWTHVGVTLDAAGNLTTLKNGLQEATVAACTYTSKGTTVIRAGNRGTSLQLNGYLSSLRVSNVAFSAGQVWQLYNATRTGSRELYNWTPYGQGVPTTVVAADSTAPNYYTLLGMGA